MAADRQICRDSPLPSLTLVTTSAPVTTAHLLLFSPNWLGDLVMALPAFQVWHSLNPATTVTVAAKPGVAPLWSLVPGVRQVVVLGGGRDGMRRAVTELRSIGPELALLLPHTFRSGWLAWRARIPRRRGTTWQWRGALVNEPVRLDGLEALHQQYEAFRLFGVAPPAVLPPPQLRPGADLLATQERKLPFAAGKRYIAILPGAARGTSKRWPAAHYVAAARAVAAARPESHFLICGTASEAEACAAVAEPLGDLATNLAGKTALLELAALLSRVAAVVCNDSGGMHLATAVGTPVVAIFGVTDPCKTGPLGHSIVVAPPGVKGQRAIPRHSAAATRALESVTPERVVAALDEVLAP